MPFQGRFFFFLQKKTKLFSYVKKKQYLCAQIVQCTIANNKFIFNLYAYEERFIS